MDWIGGTGSGSESYLSFSIPTSSRMKACMLEQARGPSAEWYNKQRPGYRLLIVVELQQLRYRSITSSSRLKWQTRFRSDGGELFAVGHCGGWIDRITGFYANQLATPVLVSLKINR